MALHNLVIVRWLLIFSLLAISISVLNAQSLKHEIRWCTIGSMEYRKCQDFAREILEDNDFELKLSCKEATNKEQCMSLVDTGRADMVTLDPGELELGGRYHSLVPIMAERYGREQDKGYYAVTVIHSLSQIYYLRDLEKVKACFPAVGQFAGWVVPMATLIDKDIIPIKDCNNLVKTAANFFGPSCSPNSLIDKYNPTGDNPQHMCELCAEERGGGGCTGNNPFANFEGAFKCLLKGGEVAFLKDSTLNEIINQPGYRGPSKSQFRLLCPNGQTDLVDNYRSCNWGFVPAHVVAVTSAVLPEMRKKYQNFLKTAAHKFGPENWDNRGKDRNAFNYSFSSNSNFHGRGNDLFGLNGLKAKPSFKLFSSGMGENTRYKTATNLMFQDTTTNLAAIDIPSQTFTAYLGNRRMLYSNLRKCPVPPAKLCVVSSEEKRKCQKMKMAFKAQGLKPDLDCVKSHSQISCMSLIKDGYADMTVLDAGDIYHAGQKFGLIPIIAEQYDLDDPSYFVVAVAQQPDKDTDLLYLKGKRSCHSGVGMAAGWVVPMSFLLTNERMRPFGCNSARAASEFFEKSCVPGVMSKEHSSGETTYGNLCDLCHGSSSSYCSRDPSEPFFGYTGALRCLVEGGGEIAFVKHTTVLENTAGKNSDWWARPMMPTDFELLCRDGTRAKHHEYERCNLGRVASNAIVTNGNKPYDIINTYIDLFMYAQQYYGSKYSEDFTFKMFVSEGGYKDLVFQDATQQLKPVPAEKRHYHEYLGHDFIQAMRIVDCTAGAAVVKLHMVWLALAGAILLSRLL